MKRALPALLLLAAVISFILPACLPQRGELPASSTSPNLQVKPVTTQTPPEPSFPVAQESQAASGLTLGAETPVSRPSWYSGEEMPPFTAQLGGGFAEEVELVSWQAGRYSGMGYSLPLTIDQIANPSVLTGLTEEQTAFLLQNGFVVIHSQEEQFGEIRKVGKIYGQPYFLTVDAAFHALHLLFDDLLKSLEKNYFSPRLSELTEAVLNEVLAYLSLVQGTPLEEDTRLAAAYLGVAFKLLHPDQPANPAVDELVDQQVAQILKGGGRAASVLLPEFEDDYGAYKPVGHYAGDAGLEQYFRAMTWLGRVHFPLAPKPEPGLTSGGTGRDPNVSEPSRAPLIITLAMRRSTIDNIPAALVYSQIHEALTFLTGPTDDAGPLELAALMDQVYGNKLTIHGLDDLAPWQEFLVAARELPAPQIHSTFAESTSQMVEEKGWRFLGQRFSMDGMMIQQLIFDQVKERGGERRLFPTGLDVMAAFGSPSALLSLEELGETTYPNYTGQMGKLRQAVKARPEKEWFSHFYDSWLYAFLPVLEPKGDSYPPFMRSPAWGYKDLNAALGSWVELKHDTALYTKMPEALAGGGPPRSGPAPAYVEPNPNAFYRMAYMAEALAAGLQERGISDVASRSSNGIPLLDYKRAVKHLGQTYKRFGDMAAQQLSGLPLSDADLELLEQCLGLHECMSEESPSHIPAGPMPPVPVAAAVSGAEDKVLQAAVGKVDRIYAVVPWKDSLEVAQGGVFSYYEFTQSRGERLSDEEWRERLDSENSPSLPPWAQNFLIPGGEPVSWLAFRTGEIYKITQAGDLVNVRITPSRTADIMGQLRTEEYVEIIEGPVQAGGYTWWKVKPVGGLSEAEAANRTGWAVEHQDWYERAYGQ